VLAASINDWDWQLLRGDAINRLLSGLFRPKTPILGCDIAGRVEAVGADVTAFAPGDEVYGDLSPRGFGAFAEYACVPPGCLAHKPAAMTFEQAAAIPQAAMLAVQGLVDVGAIRAGQSVLLNGAGGGTGTFALQIAKLHDVDVTVVDKASKLDMLRAMGANHVVDYRSEDFTGGRRSYDLVLDVKTTRSPFAYARVLNRGGTYVTVGGDLPRLLQIALMGPLIARVKDRRLRVAVLKANKDLGYMNELFEAGKLRPVIDGSYPLAELPEAFRRFGSGDHKGKIVVAMA
jgi:NADPH:quinone reductase-like Zn-dependent oxidoreductase